MSRKPSSQRAKKFDAEDYVKGNHPDVVKAHKLAQQVTDLEKQKADLVARLAAAEDRASQALAISDPKHPAKIRTQKRKGVRSATPLFMASDWHVEEPVLAEKVNGLNFYDVKEAERRSRNYWDGCAWLTKHMRTGPDSGPAYSCTNGVLWLGGDMITSYLHEENEESNPLSPLEAVMFAQRLVMEGIDHLLDECDFEQLLVVCNWGNHGRMHKRKRYKTAAKNNLEWLMYHSIAQAYEKDERVKFQIAAGAHEYADIEGWLVRFFHGDDFLYQGGVGGLSVPLLRGLARLQSPERGREVHLNVLGHFHTAQDFGVAVVNDCLIGYNEYALSKNMPYSDPTQTFVLIDQKRGKCVRTPIWVT